jgi:hypothetical protein
MRDFMPNGTERLSIQLARDHVDGGHGGGYAHYCYRCEYFEELSASAGWQLSAIEKRRFWVYPRGSWTGRLGIGGDEYQRRTVYIGRLVIALWRCRCEDCKGDLERLRDLASRDLGQEDRDKQPGGSDA